MNDDLFMNFNRDTNENSGAEPVEKAVTAPSPAPVETDGAADYSPVEKGVEAPVESAEETPAEPAVEQAESAVEPEVETTPETTAAPVEQPVQQPAAPVYQQPQQQYAAPQQPAAQPVYRQPVQQPAAPVYQQPPQRQYAAPQQPAAQPVYRQPVQQPAAPVYQQPPQQQYAAPQQPAAQPVYRQPVQQPAAPVYQQPQQQYAAPQQPAAQPVYRQPVQQPAAPVYQQPPQQQYAAPQQPAAQPVYRQPVQQPAAPVYQQPQQQYAAPTAQQQPAKLIGDEKKKKPRVVPIRETVMCWACLGVLSLFALFMIIGFTNAFGYRVGLVTAINFYIKLFTMSRGKIYRCLAQLSIAITYTIFVILLIKSIVACVKLLLKFRKCENVKERRGLLNAVYSHTANRFANMIFLIMLCYALSGDSISALSYVVIVFGCALYFACYALTATLTQQFGKNKNFFLSFTLYMLRPVIYITLISVTAKFAVTPVGYNLSYGLPTLFTGHLGAGAKGVVTSIYEYLGKDAVNLVMCIIFLLLVTDAVKEIGLKENRFDTYDSMIKGYGLKLIITASVAVALNVIILIISGVVDIGTIIKNIFTLLRVGCIPVILLGAAMMFASSKVFGEGVRVKE